MFAKQGTHRRMLAAVLAFAAPAFLLTACNDDPLFDLPPDPPTNVATVVNGQDVTVNWTPGANATSQEVRLSPVVAVPASAGNALQAEDYVAVYNDNTTNTHTFTDVEPGPYTVTVTAINASSRAPSEIGTVTVQEPGGAAPVLTAFYADETDPTTLIVEWTGVEGAVNYRVTLTPDDDTPEFVDIAPASATSFPNGPVNDGTTYTAQVCAIFAGGEETCSNTLPFTADFFPWDEWFPTSLHETGAGKTTYYDAENGGFERFTGVPYEDLACIGCHSAASGLGPVNGRTCDRCHTTVDPGLGDVVNTSWEDGVCLDCHSRQKTEIALEFSDVHRDLGFDCMRCHTLEDVHGDGNEYSSLQEVGAIDASCDDCHNEDNNFVHPADPHGGKVSCAACHAQSAVTCNNCHFEAQVNNTGKFFLGPATGNWLWLGNRLKRDGSGETEVYPVNYQSVEYDSATYVAFGFYTPHTIGTGRACASCHDPANNPAIAQYNAEGIIDVASWDEGTQTMTYPTGVIPMPEDYLTALQFDFVTTDSEDGVGAVWTFLKAGADTIRVIPEFMTPLSFDQMADLDMVPPGP